MVEQTEAVTPKELPITQTLIPAEHPDAVRALRGWKKPRYAYILFEQPQILNRANWAEPKLSADIFTMNVEHRPEQTARISEYIARGFRILDYGNFPMLDDTSPERRSLATLYSGHTKVNPWLKLRSLCESFMHKVGAVEAVRAELAETRDDYEKKLKAKTAEIEKLRKEANAKG